MDISSETLGKVKETLKNFRSDIEGIGATAILRSQSCLAECQEKIADTSEQVVKIKYKVTQFTRIIQNLQQEITSVQSELQQFYEIIPQLEQQSQKLRIQLSELSDRLAAIQAQSMNTDDEYDQKWIQDQINMLQTKMNTVQNSIRDAEQQIRQMEDKKGGLQKDICDYSSKKAEYENKLSVAKKRLDHYQQKLDKLNIAVRNIHMDFNSYIQSVKKFEDSSVESVASKHRVVDECIRIIEEMESVM